MLPAYAADHWRNVPLSSAEYDSPGGENTVALPPWQSVQPSTTASFACIVLRSDFVWHDTQPADFLSGSSQLWNAGAGGVATYSRSTGSSSSLAHTNAQQNSRTVIPETMRNLLT